MHQQHYYYAPENEEGIADGIGDGITHGRDGAVERILHCSESGGGGAAACTAAKVDGRTELEYLGSHPDSDKQGHRGGNDACDK